MNDTPQHIKELQLKIWLAKSPMERLHQLIMDNDTLFKFWGAVKPQAKEIVSIKELEKD
jgi:hypothetical protein